MSHFRVIFGRFAIAMIMAAAFVQIEGCSSTPLTQYDQVTQEELARADFGTLPSDYQDQIRAWFQDKLFDPYSARYGFAEPTKQKYDGQYGLHVVTGVNAKNRLGGYTGLKQYNFFFPNGGPMRPVDLFFTSYANDM